MSPTHPSLGVHARYHSTADTSQPSSIHCPSSSKPVIDRTPTQREDFSAGSTLQERADMACGLLSEIWSKHGILPKKWRIDDIDDIELDPFAFTASSDVKKASRSGKPLALKFLRPCYRIKGPEERVMELLREACLWSLLHHRHILPFLGIFAEQPRLALVSPYQAAGSLHEFLNNQPGADRVELLRCVASGLKYLHTLPVPIVHGDIRAMNIVVDREGYPLIMDFDCSTFVDERGHAICPNSEQLRGTPRHMPPEKMLPDWPYPITLQADIWSFAILCIEVFTGERPFNHIANDVAVVLEVSDRYGYPPRPRGPFAAQLTDDIWELLRKCWELDPSRRPAIDTIEALFALRAHSHWKRG